MKKEKQGVKAGFVSGYVEYRWGDREGQGGRVDGFGGGRREVAEVTRLEIAKVNYHVK